MGAPSYEGKQVYMGLDVRYFFSYFFPLTFSLRDRAGKSYGEYVLKTY